MVARRVATPMDVASYKLSHVSVDRSQVRAKVASEQGISRARVVEALSGGTRAARWAAVAAALEAGEVYARRSTVTTSAGWQRGVVGLYLTPGPALSPSPADIEQLRTPDGLSEMLRLTRIGAPKFASALGVSPSLVYAWMGGRRPIPDRFSAEVLSKCAKLTQTSAGLRPARAAGAFERVMREIDAAGRRGTNRKRAGVYTEAVERLLRRAIDSGDVVEQWGHVPPQQQRVRVLYARRWAPRRLPAVVTLAELDEAARVAGWGRGQLASKLHVDISTLERWHRRETVPEWAAERARKIVDSAPDAGREMAQWILAQVNARGHTTVRQLEQIPGVGQSVALHEGVRRLVDADELHYEYAPGRNAAGHVRHFPQLAAGPATPTAAGVPAGGQLRQLRETRGLSRYALADELGCDYTQVYAWERGTHPMPPSRWAQAQQVFARAGLAPQPYRGHEMHSDDELRTCALEYVAAHGGASRTEVTQQAMAGDVRRRWSLVQQLLDEHLLVEREAPSTRKGWTKRGLFLACTDDASRVDDERKRVRAAVLAAIREDPRRGTNRRALKGLGSVRDVDDALADLVRVGELHESLNRLGGPAWLLDPACCAPTSVEVPRH